MGIVLFAFSGCSDDGSEDFAEMQNATFGKVCTKWGASKSEVADYMDNCEMDLMESEFVCYNGKQNGVQTISYLFENNALQASLVLISRENTSLEELKSLFDAYEHLGEKNSLDIYVSEASNTIVMVGEKINYGQTYYAVGYVSLGGDREVE